MNTCVSIIAYNNLALTKKCVDRVVRFGGYAKLVLTDNGSAEAIGPYFQSLAEKDSKVIVVSNSTNRGFMEPNVKALELSEGCEVLVLLNNDAEVVDEDWLKRLTQPFEINPLVAITGPHSGASRLRDDLSGHRCPVDQMEYVEGSCIAVRTALARKHGLWGPGLQFAYGEDSDLCLRMREAGYELKTVDIQVHHEGGATSSQIREQVQPYEIANHAISSKRWRRYLATRTFNPTLVVRRQGAMGDVLLITPIIDALAKKYPETPIWVETQPVDLFLYNPKVSSTTRGNYDGHNVLRINLDMAYENLPGLHIVDAYQEVAEKAVGESLEVERKTTFNKGECIWDLPGDDWVAIHAEPTTWPGKNWPPERWNQVINYLHSQSLRVVLVGTSKMCRLPFDLDLREQTSPLDLAAVLSQCKLFIGHDSFPLHVAQSQGCPVIGLFGTTRGHLILTDSSPSVAIDGTGPCAGERHRNPGLTFCPCSGECMTSIPASQVIEAIPKLLTPAIHE